MIETHLKTTFPIYDDRDKQNYRKSWCLDDHATFQLITSTKRFLPFQFMRTMSADAFSDMTFTLYAYDDSASWDITTAIPSADFDINTYDGDDWLTYLGNEDLNDELECGVYYLKIQDTTNTWYSELFRAVDMGGLDAVLPLRIISDTFPKEIRIIETDAIRRI
jgi:hypothetical protein